MNYQKEIKQLQKQIQKATPKEICQAASFADIACKEKLRRTEVIFPLAFAIHAMGSMEALGLCTSEAKDWLTEAGSYLEDQAVEYSFNYWIRDTELDQDLKLPDDLDDTALAYSALKVAGRSVLQQTFIKTMKLEQRPGGPFKTWFLKLNNENKDKWGDVDPIINAHYFYLLSLHNIKLQNLQEYLLNALETNKISSPYYEYDMMFFFYLAKALHSQGNNELRKALTKKLQQYRWQDLAITEKLLFALSKAYLGEKMPKASIDEIIERVHEKAGACALPLCFCFSYEGEKTYAGNSYASAALLLELLILHSHEEEKKKTRKSNTEKENSEGDLESLVSQIGENLQVKIKPSIFGSELGSILSNSRSQNIIKLPVIIFLSAHDARTTKKKDLQLLSDFINSIFYGWTALTFLDDAIDGQMGSASKLPLMMHCYRQSWIEFDSFIEKAKLELSVDFQQLASELENQYQWEATHLSDLHYNLKDYSYVRKRMSLFAELISHLPYLWVEMTESQRQDLLEFLLSLMLIDQINDDAHDWEKDMKAGNLTFTLRLLLDKSNADDQGAVPTLRKIFWEEIFAEIYGLADHEFNKATTLLGNLPLNTSYLQKLLASRMKPLINAREQSVLTKEVAANLQAQD